jgi:hypothetical protein
LVPDCAQFAAFIIKCGIAANEALTRTDIPEVPCDRLPGHAKAASADSTETLILLA